MSDNRTPPQITAVVQKKTGRFMADGHDIDADYERVAVPRNPDCLREKWNGTEIVPKSEKEIAHALSVRHRIAALASLALEPAARAVLVRGLEVRLGHRPTQDEIDKELDAYVEVYP